MMDIYQFFAEHSIQYERHDHPPVFTVEQANRLVPHLRGAKTKNLFLRDKKGQCHFLVVVGHEKSVDLKVLSSLLKVGKLNLASPDRLQQYLGVEPGAVSILGVVNDLECQVRFIVDRDLWKAKAFQCHPLVNTSTVVIPNADLKRFLDLTGHEAEVIGVPSRS